MSLLVWLPLMGNYNNQGLSGNIPFTETGTVSNTTGKIGTCKSFSSSNSIGNYDFTLGNEASLTFWMNASSIPSGTTVAWLVDLASSSGYANAVLGIAMSGSKIVVGVGGKYNQNIAHGFVADKWYHVSVVWKNPTAYLYINGSLHQSYTGLSGGTKLTSTKISLASNAAGTTTSRFTGKLNDVRVYDHALSVKEIKDVARGMILHYPLDNVGRFNWLTTGDTEYTLTRGSSNKYITFPYLSNIKTSGETSFTVEFDGKSSIDNIRFRFCFRNSSTLYAYSAYVYMTTEYQHYTVTINGSVEDLVYVRLQFGSGSDGATIYVKNVKLTTDINPGCSNKIFDSSGYGHHATITGTLENISSSVRNRCCVYFPQCSELTNYAVTDGLICTPSDSITISSWVKHDASSSHVSSLNFSIGSSKEFQVSCAAHARLGLVVNDTRYITNSDSILDDNEWHMLTITYDGETIRRYVDAVEYSNTSVSGSLASGERRFYVGSYATDTSYWTSQFYESDIRMYATALSPEDIKSLYNVGESIDRNGNIWAYEFDEKDSGSTSFMKNGCIEAVSAIENTVEGNAGILSNDVHANQLLEV